MPTSFSEKDFDTTTYNNVRPTYPDQFYDKILEYHNLVKGNKTDLALDVGCGPGFVAFKLADRFQKVIGTDVSESMIAQCNSDPKASNKDKIEFFVSPAELSPLTIAPASVDLITGAECLHWVDMDKFYEECARILKPGATLAYWFYLEPVFVGHPKASALNEEFSYESSIKNHGTDYEHYLGPYFQQPGHDNYRHGLSHVSPPSDLFSDVVRHYYNPLEHGTTGQYTTLFIRRVVTLNYYRNQAKSWSAYYNWKKLHPDKPDVADELVNKLAECMGVGMDDPIEVIYPTVYTFARRK